MTAPDEGREAARARQAEADVATVRREGGPNPKTWMDGQRWTQTRQRPVLDALKRGDPPPGPEPEPPPVAEAAPTPEPDDVGQTADRTDLRNAELLVEWFGADLRYVGTWGKGLAWDGRRWAIDSEGRWQQAAANTARLMFDDALVGLRDAMASGDGERMKQARAKVAWAATSHGAPRLAAMVTLARSFPSIVVRHGALDRDPMLLNVSNGVLDLRTGVLREHRREDMITKLAPVDYDPTATCARFERFMDEIMAGDADLVAFLQRYLGYCLTGDVREHVLAFWHGTGCNGKSLLALVLLHVMGDYAGKAAPDLLFRSELTDRHPTELADLHGLRLVVCNETTRGRSWDEGTVKDVTGGDRIRARRMREDFWEFDPTHKIVVFGNHKPRIACVDDAMRRRLRLVPFAVSFEGSKDTGLLDILKAEAPGILRYFVEGGRAWVAGGLPVPGAVRAATDDYMRDEDTVGQFLDRECRFEPDAKIARKELRAHYVRWSEERDDEKPVSPKSFADAVRRRGAIERGVRTTSGPRDGWHGVRLATDAEKTAAATWTGRSDVVTRSEEPAVSPQPPARDGANREVPATGHDVTTDTGDDSAGEQDTFAGYLDSERIGRT